MNSVCKIEEKSIGKSGDLLFTRRSGRQRRAQRTTRYGEQRVTGTAFFAPILADAPKLK